MSSRRCAPAASGVVLCLLFGWKLSAQSYNPLYLPLSSNLQQWTCVDQNKNPVPYAYWWVQYGYAGYYYSTNYHFHDSYSHPTSIANPSSGQADRYGNFSFSLITSLVGQAEFYDLYCRLPDTSYEGLTVRYAVGYGDLHWTNVPGVLYQIGGGTTGHGDNSGDHWMLTGPAYGIYYAAQEYISQYNPGNQVCVNDMGLPFGGKFDISDNWTSPHASHDRGSAVDVATTASQCPAAYVVNPDAFLAKCQKYGALPMPISQIDPADVHCNWFDPASYPH